MNRTLNIASYAAIWPALYVTGALVCFMQVAGLEERLTHERQIAALMLAMCTSAAAYLLDRVKLRDAWLDPADALAHPGRFEFIARHAAALRMAVIGLFVASGVIGALLLRGGALIPLLAGAGVLAYAFRPRGAKPRPKDLLILKNFYVALGITGFCVVIASAAVDGFTDVSGLRAAAAPMAVSAALLMPRILADAILCDLDDEAADRQFRTSTLPTRIGRTHAWNIALVLRLLLAAALAATPLLPAAPRLAWAAVTLASTIGMRVIAPVRMRDWVDMRLPMEAAVVTLVLWAL